MSETNIIATDRTGKGSKQLNFTETTHTTRKAFKLMQMITEDTTPKGGQIWKATTEEQDGVE